MSYQFIHVEAYSRTAGAGKAGGRSMGNVLDEADRKEGNCPHIDPEKLADPDLAPEVLYGYSLENVEKIANKWAEQAKDARGHALRKDGHCLLGGIISFPREEGQEAWNSFKTDATKWLKKEYGNSLRSVVEHKDESHPHLHFYCVPERDKSFSSVHKGQEAARQAKSNGLKKGEQNLAYKDAMREFQDKFNEDVGQKHGLARIGPGDRRLTREEWKKEQTQAKSLQKAKEKAISIENNALDKADGIVNQAEEKAQKIAGWGASFGEFGKNAMAKYHTPTKEANKEKEDAKQELERVKDIMYKNNKTYEKNINTINNNKDIEIQKKDREIRAVELERDRYKRDLREMNNRYAEQEKERKALEREQDRGMDFDI